MLVVVWFLDIYEFYPIGLLMLFTILVLLITTVRCPKCKINWIWMAASKRGITEKWGKGVMMLTDCPECKKDEIS